MIIGLTLEREDERGLWKTFGPPAVSPLCVCAVYVCVCERVRERCE